MAAPAATHCYSSSSSQTLLFLSLVVILLLNPAGCRADNIILYSGETLPSGESLEYASYTFIMQHDCNLVLYDGTAIEWSSKTYDKARDCTCTLTVYGILEIITPDGIIIWRSGTQHAKGNYVLVLQKDRNVVIYGGSIWATGTQIVPSGGISMVTNHTALIEGTNHTALIEGSNHTALNVKGSRVTA